MPNPNFVVGVVEQISPEAGTTGGFSHVESAGGAGPDRGFKTIRLRGQAREVLMDEGDPRSEDWESLMEVHRRMDRPVVLEVAAQGPVSQTLIPSVGPVRQITRGSSDYGIHLYSSPTPLRLNAAEPSAQAMLEQLRTAMRAGQTMMVTADPRDRQILDVRVAERAAAPARSISRRDREDEAIKLVSTMSVTRAQSFFKSLIADGCGMPATGSCLPFRFTGDFCFAFADTICDRLKAEGIIAGKAWLYGDLGFQTNNHIDCYQEWDYHVAAFVRTTKTHDRDEFLVMDPVVMHARGPVPLSHWRRTIHGTRGELRITSSQVYDQPVPGYFVNEDRGITDEYLKSMRIQLNLRRHWDEGPPPYDC